MLGKSLVSFCRISASSLSGKGVNLKNHTAAKMALILILEESFEEFNGGYAEFYFRHDQTKRNNTVIF